MLRKGIVALMITVMSVGAATAGDDSAQGLIGFLRGPSIGRPDTRTKKRTNKPESGIRHAVVADAEKEVPEVRQVSLRPELKPADDAPQPIEIPAPVPNARTVSGPQYFSATNSQGQTMPLHPGQNWQTYSAPQATGAIHPVSGRRILPNGHGYGIGHGGSGNHHLPMVTNNVGLSGPAGALYPSPRPGIPQQVSGTAITHHALHPHEMMYPHRYKAMYGPYYYKVNGGWMVTPFGVWSKENWKLQGTEVDVKYKSHISPFAMFKPPFIR